MSTDSNDLLLTGSQRVIIDNDARTALLEAGIPLERLYFGITFLAGSTISHLLAGLDIFSITETDTYHTFPFQVELALSDRLQIPASMLSLDPKRLLSDLGALLTSNITLIEFTIHADDDGSKYLDIYITFALNTTVEQTHRCELVKVADLPTLLN